MLATVFPKQRHIQFSQFSHNNNKIVSDFNDRRKLVLDSLYMQQVTVEDNLENKQSLSAQI